jgi:hypothetical protein
MVDTTGRPCAIASASAIPYPSKRDASTNTSDARYNSMIRSGDGAEHRHPVVEAIGLNVSVELRGSGRIAGSVTRDRQSPGHLLKRGNRRDEQIVSFDRQHRTDREKPNETIIAAMRWRNRIITRSHNTDALSRDAVITDHDPGGCVARDHHARGSSERSALALAEGVCLLGVGTGVQRRRNRISNHRASDKKVMNLSSRWFHGEFLQAGLRAYPGAPMER